MKDCDLCMIDQVSGVKSVLEELESVRSIPNKFGLRVDISAPPLRKAVINPAPSPLDTGGCSSSSLRRDAFSPSADEGEQRTVFSPSAGSNPVNAALNSMQEMVRSVEYRLIVRFCSLFLCALL